MHTRTHTKPHAASNLLVAACVLYVWSGLDFGHLRDLSPTVFQKLVALALNVLVDDGLAVVRSHGGFLAGKIQIWAC